MHSTFHNPITLTVFIIQQGKITTYCTKTKSGCINTGVSVVYIILHFNPTPHPHLVEYQYINYPTYLWNKLYYLMHLYCEFWVFTI